MNQCTCTCHDNIVGIISSFGFPCSKCSGSHVQPVMAPEETLRDKFAAAALTGYIAKYGNFVWSTSDAEGMYKIADSMIEIRDKKN